MAAIDVRFKLWDLVKGEELLGQSNAALPADMRLAAHRVADSIYQNLTGERGVFSTRIAYVTLAANRYTCTSPMPTAKAGRSRWPAPIRSSRRPGRPTARSWPTSPSKARRPWSGCRDVSSGKRRMLANFRGSNSAPAWSPDGRDLA